MKHSFSFMKAFLVVLLALFIYLFREELVHAIKEFIASRQ